MSKGWVIHHPEAGERSRLKRTYGITIEEYIDMLIAQNYRCALCNKHQTEFKYPFYVDHNHKTGSIRGLLCSRCNQLVACAEAYLDNSLEKAFIYLNRYKNT